MDSLRKAFAWLRERWRRLDNVGLKTVADAEEFVECMRDSAEVVEFVQASKPALTEPTRAFEWHELPVSPTVRALIAEDLEAEWWSRKVLNDDGWRIPTAWMTEVSRVEAA